MYILIAFFAPLFYALANIIECQLSNKTFKSPTTMIFYISLMNAFFLPLLLLVEFPTIPPIETWWMYFTLALMGVAYLYPYYIALKVIDTSIVGALMALGQIIIPILSYFLLSEKLGLVQYIGFIIIIMSSVALSIKNIHNIRLSKAFYYMLLVSIAISFNVVFQKCVLDIDEHWVNVVFYPQLISGFLPLLFLFNKKMRVNIFKNFNPYIRNLKIFAINEFFCFLALVAGIYGLSGLPAVASASISSTMPMFMLIISYVLFKKFNICLKEKVSKAVLVKKMFFFMLMTLGVILVVA